MDSDDERECELARAPSRIFDYSYVQEEGWAADANLFISQEEDDTQLYSVRVAVFDLLSVCLD